MIEVEEGILTKIFDGLNVSPTCSGSWIHSDPFSLVSAELVAEVEYPLERDRRGCVRRENGWGQQLFDGETEGLVAVNFVLVVPAPRTRGTLVALVEVSF